MSKWIQWKGLYHREVARYFKVPLQTIGAPIVSTLLYLLIFGVSLGKSIHLAGGFPYLAFLIPGLIAMSLIRNSFDNSTSALMGQKYVNELQDLRTAPLSIHQIVSSKSIASLTRGLIVGAITYLVGQAFYLSYMGHFLPIAAPLTFIYFIVIGGLAFAGLGIAIGMWSRSFEHVGAVSMLILLPLIYLGGVFFNLENVHPFWQTLSHFNPLFYTINGVRYGMLGQSDTSLPLAIGVTFAFALLCHLLALLSLRKGSRYLR
ncbi:ABC transporter permease [Candidatus Neptunochlamydia vexilliferae]|nr:ABC transporter permease [Candidatus Neptunochlamydia vexilliferae]